MGDKGRQDPRDGVHAIQQRETKRGTMGDKGRQDPQEGVQWETGRQDPREGGHTIQQRETRRGAMGDEGGHTIQQREARRKTSCETRGDKTLGKADTQSNTGKQEGYNGRQRETKGDKGRQDPHEGGHTIQHQGGHLKKALRIPNSTLFGEKTTSIPSKIEQHAIPVSTV